MDYFELCCDIKSHLHFLVVDDNEYKTIPKTIHYCGKKETCFKSTRKITEPLDDEIPLREETLTHVADFDARNGDIA